MALVPHGYLIDQTAFVFWKSYNVSVKLNVKVNFAEMVPCLFRTCCDIFESDAYYYVGKGQF